MANADYDGSQAIFEQAPQTNEPQEVGNRAGFWNRIWIQRTALVLETANQQMVALLPFVGFVTSIRSSRALSPRLEDVSLVARCFGAMRVSTQPS